VAVLELRDAGLYCPVGDFYIDPWAAVDRAIVTHAHSDHACPGSHAYLTARPGAALLRARLGPDAAIQTAPYGDRVAFGEVSVSLHPAGHVLGSAQVRIEHRGEVWVVSGDYKLSPDPTCEPFEPLRCHTFVSESTFGLPIFRWPEAATVIEDIRTWWSANREAGKASVLFAYPLGKAQRILATLDTSIGPVYAHGAVERISRIYREQGVALPATPPPGAESRGALIVAPPSCMGSPWMKRFPAAATSTAMASGWMRIRGTRRRRSLDRGFVISDHADWPGLLAAIDETRAESVWVTHGIRAPLVRWLEEHGRNARVVEARFEGEREDAEPECES
jgi:putative mRNA 3-end processing factor